MAGITKSLDLANDLTHFTLSGKVDTTEVKQAIEAFYSGQVTKRVLWDLTDSDVSELSKPEVESIASTPRAAQQQRQLGKTALVAPEDLAYGLSRMYQALTHLENLPFETQVFRDKDEAMNWLLEP